jgi:pilus assembly protein Flp/PilA
MLMMIFNYLMLFKNDDEGQGMVEYALIIGLIAVVVIAALVVLGPAIRDMLLGVSNDLTPAP